MVYALDTNTISFLLRGEVKVVKCFQKEIVKVGNPYVIPPIVYFEIRRWLLNKPTKALYVFSQHFDRMFGNVKNKADMSSSVWDKAVDIYISLKDKGQLIGDADILIAAYCIDNDYTLVTDNERDFGRINEIKIVNWKK